MESILNNNYSKKLLYGLTFILIILAFLTIYLFVQNQKLKNQISQKVLPTILTPTPNLILSEVDKELACIEEGADWLAEFNECEGPTLTESFCQKQGGKFFECESPCRNNSKSDMCIQVCTVVCKFDSINGNVPTLNSDFSKGWYWGDKNQKKPGTPNDWVYTDAGRSSCWHEAGIECNLPPETDSTYKCPENGYVNCMPGPDNPELRWECTSEYQEWAKINCPDYQGITY